MLLSVAVRERDYVLGKFLGVWTVLMLAVLLSLASIVGALLFFSPAVVSDAPLLSIVPPLLALGVQGLLWTAVSVACSAMFRHAAAAAATSVVLLVALPTRVLPLSKETISQNTRLTAGGDESLMPRFAATMGMAPILAARKCLLLACFAEQEAPLRAILARGAPTPFLPASYLWRHPDFHLVYTADKIRL